MPSLKKNSADPPLAAIFYEVLKIKISLIFILTEKKGEFEGNIKRQLIT